MRKPLLAANWKINKNLAEVASFFKVFIPEVSKVNREIVICVPAAYLQEAKAILSKTEIKLGAQNVYHEQAGAYTGEISVEMAKDFADYVIIGHSERRKYFDETDEIINKKVKLVLGSGLRPILCVGETLEQRKKGKAKQVVEQQLMKALKGIERVETSEIATRSLPASARSKRAISECDQEHAPGFSPAVLDSLVIAYEPVWAIGTGINAPPEQAQEMHKFIRAWLAKGFGREAEGIRLLYGGSATPENIDSLMTQKDIDGALVGGASLKPESFARIVNYGTSTKT